MSDNCRDKGCFTAVLPTNNAEYFLLFTHFMNHLFLELLLLRAVTFLEIDLDQLQHRPQSNILPRRIF